MKNEEIMRCLGYINNVTTDMAILLDRYKKSKKEQGLSGFQIAELPEVQHRETMIGKLDEVHYLLNKYYESKV